MDQKVRIGPTKYLSISNSFGQVDSMCHAFGIFSELGFSLTRLFDVMMYSMDEIYGKGRISLIII